MSIVLVMNTFSLIAANKGKQDVKTLRFDYLHIITTLTDTSD